MVNSGQVNYLRHNYVAVYPTNSLFVHAVYECETETMA